VADVIIRDEQMLDVVAPESPMPATGGRESEVSRSGATRLVAAAIGVGCAAILTGFFVWGSVRVEAGTRSGVRSGIDSIWTDFTDYLSRQGAGPELVLVVSGIAALTVLGSCLLVGLAFAMRDDETDAE
jgi:hypothetical protein